MTRKDYIAIAAIVANRRELATFELRGDARDRVLRCLTSLSYDLHDVMAAENSRFDRAKFLAACGIQS